jgi:aspartate/methionine/tyrosine aminotransferase/methylase of polypeptide subunit release factors
MSKILTKLDKNEEKPALEFLLELRASLESPATNLSAVRSLHELAERAELAPDGVVSCKSVHIPQADKTIRLLLHAAVFSPEYWGRTFAEGLIKQPEIFYGKKVVELGTGSGWISLLLLLKTGVAQVLALDLNPVAVLFADLNKWLNGTTRDGALVKTQLGIPLVEALQITESDLLTNPIEAGLKFDHVIGCIPQVLHPDDAIKSQEKPSTEVDLYNLSNYCFQQGILEDRYGLPLIARALEESQLCLSPGGKVTLILGGRPGQAAIESAFRRRGFRAEVIWSRRIPQADDTDLASLVQLEKAYDIKFHFFVSRNSQQSVSADTAVALLKDGKQVYHDLLVYEAVTAFEKPTFKVVSDLHAMGLDGLRRELDLSPVTEEQISFISKLTDDLHKYGTLPYPHERGNLSSRTRLAKFLAIYCHYQVDADQLFIGPERAQLIRIVLNMVLNENDRVLLSEGLTSVYENIIDSEHKIIRGNDDLTELLLLDEWLVPKVVLMAPTQLDTPSPMMFKAIVDQALNHPDRIYIIDDSAHFDISSSLNANIFLRLAGQQALPPNLIFVCGLVKSTVAADLELSFLLNAPDDWAINLAIGAELTYSRIGYISQLYYKWLFDELLAFPFDEAVPERTRPNAEQKTQIGNAFRSIAADPTFAPKPIEMTKDVIRLDLAELGLPVPAAISKGLIKGFLDPQEIDLRPLVTRRVLDYLRATRGASINDPERVVLSQGVFPLFGALLRSMYKRLGRAPIVAVPAATFGLIYPAVRYHGGELRVIPVNEERKFAPTEYELASLDFKPDLMWLTQPGNPAGFYKEPFQLQETMDYCEERKIFLLADEIFFLLSDIATGSKTPFNLSFAQFCTSSAGQYLFLTDGLSKPFAAGGLRTGAMICPDAAWAREVTRHVHVPPHAVLRAWDAVYAPFADGSLQESIDLDQDRRALAHYMQETRQLISSQCDRILQLLRKYDLDDGVQTGLRGGFFVLAKLGDRAEQLAKQERLLVNSSEWSRTPGWVRICFGLEPVKFEEAMVRLERFLAKGAKN